jgi:D-psicose/D-tagatose/L-ribulose 3-epimerase
MHVAMANWMRAESIETTIGRLVRYGYDSIEISGEPKIFHTKRVGSLLKENGLKCWGVVSLMHEGRDLINADETIRAKTIQYLKDCVIMAKELEGCEVTVVPSQVGKVTPMDTSEQEWTWAIEGLKEVYAYSEKAGIVLAIEPINRFETHFVNRHDQALLLAEAVGPHCGVCLDCFHLNIEEIDPYQAILNTGDRLFDFHATENTRMACGLGSYDWVRLLTTLRAIDYDGALTVEYVAPLDRTPANRYENAIAPAEAEMTLEQLDFIKDHASGVLSEEFYSWLAEESIKTLRQAMAKVGV